MDLEAWSTRLKVFADATRVRLLVLLAGEELTVAELSAITQLAQPRVSTHLAKLKEAGLVRDRRAGVSAYYRFDEDNLDAAQRELWRSLRNGSDDPLLRNSRWLSLPKNKLHRSGGPKDPRVEVPFDGPRSRFNNPEKIT